MNHRGSIDDHCCWQAFPNRHVVQEGANWDHSPQVEVGVVHHHLPEECYHLCLDNCLAMVIDQSQ